MLVVWLSHNTYCIKFLKLVIESASPALVGYSTAKLHYTQNFFQIFSVRLRNWEVNVDNSKIINQYSLMASK